MSYILYGGLFIMSGAYALSRNAHVRGDVIFRLLRPRVQATHRAGAVLHLLLSRASPSLIIAGYGYAHDSFGYREVSVNSPVGVPIWQLKALIPLAGIMLFIQGIAQVIRCILAHPDRPLAAPAARRRGARERAPAASTRSRSPRRAAK